MSKSLRVPLMMLALLAGASLANAQQISDPRVADLVQAGKLRVGLFPSFLYTKDPVTSQLRGVGIEVARALAARLGIEFVPVEYPSPLEVVACLKAGVCEVAFLGIDPSRTAEVGFSPPFIEVDFTYLVPAGSLIRSLADADRPGIRIAGARNHASTMALSRILKQTAVVYAETPDATFDLLRTGHVDVQAGVRSALLEYSAQLPSSRVLEDRYGANRLAMAVPKDQAGRLAYISDFLEAAKASGLVRQAMDGAALRGIQVASPEPSDARK
jgi:polar amino acid transport system substrate-binding protein